MRSQHPAKTLCLTAASCLRLGLAVASAAVGASPSQAQTSPQPEPLLPKHH